MYKILYCRWLGYDFAPPKMILDNVIAAETPDSRTVNRLLSIRNIILKGTGLILIVSAIDDEDVLNAYWEGKYATE